MLLRYGVISMSVAVFLALALFAALTLRDRPEEVAAAEAAAVASSPQRTTEEAYKDPRDLMLDLPSQETEPEAEPVQQSEPQPEPVSKSEPVAQLEPQSKPEPAPEPESKSEPGPDQQGALPVAEGDWPKPKKEEIAAASKPRSYDWAPGAVMTLSVKSIGLRNVPVMGDDSEESLSKGVAHVPETSMPWTRSPHRNVYLAGHKLGWPGTASHLVFYNLDRLENGNEILLKDRQGKSYRYRVSEKFVAGPEDRWVMGQEVNRDMVTLQTCTGPNFSKRLIVRADRV